MLATEPKDRPRQAAIIGVCTAVFIPLFFVFIVPALRSYRGLIWLCTAGGILGALIYARNRAKAYLRDAPDRWDVFGYYRLLNPARYEEAGRPFVRWQIAGSVLLTLWWIAVGVFVVSFR